jgi:hypothetical protein
MPSQSNSRPNSSSRRSQDQIVQELNDSIDEVAESFVDLHQSMDEDRLEAGRSQHRALLALSVPGPPSSSSIPRKPVGAPSRAASTNNPQQPSQRPQEAVTFPSASGSHRGHGRNDSVKRAASVRGVRSRRLSDLACDAPIPVEFDPALQAPMLQSELESEHAEDAPIPMTELEAERAHGASTPPSRYAQEHVQLPLEAQNLVRLDRITAHEDRACSLPAGQLISYTGETTVYPRQPLRQYVDPPMDVTRQHTFHNATAANLDTSQFRNPRDSMAVTTLHHVDHPVPEEMRHLVATEYQAPYHCVANLMRKAWQRFPGSDRGTEPS